MISVDSRPSNGERLAAFKARRMATVVAVKDNPCTDCGKSYPTKIMQFDHVRGDKKFALTKAWQHNEAEVLEELAKCELVCATCHWLRTVSRRPQRQPRPAWEEKRFLWYEKLKSRPCDDCGESFDWRVMQFHHDHEVGVKRDEIGRLFYRGQSFDVIEAEAAKCLLLCPNCHACRTHNC